MLVIDDLENSCVIIDIFTLSHKASSLYTY